MKSVLDEDRIEGVYLGEVANRRRRYLQELKGTLIILIVYGVPLSTALAALATPVLIYQGRSDELVETFIGLGLLPLFFLSIPLLFITLSFWRDLRILKVAWVNRRILNSGGSYCLYLRDEAGSQGIPFKPLPGGAMMDSPWRPSSVGIKDCLRPLRIQLVGLWMPCDNQSMPDYAPIYSTQEAWEDDVRNLMDGSVAIILDIYKSGKGIMWECEQILEGTHALKTLYIRTDPNTGFSIDLDRRLVQICAWSMNVGEEDRLPRGNRIRALPKDFISHLEPV